MRVYKGSQNVIPYKNGNSVRKRWVGKEQKIYTCFDCKYESNRRFNVERHQQRIHWNQKLHVCCGTQFYNKGDYYMHCEITHPETRLHTITSRTKYKITKKSVAIDHTPSEKITNSCELHFEQQFLEKTCITDQLLKRELKRRTSLKYLFTYSDLDIENVPLINFFTDRRLESYLKMTCSKLPSNLLNKSSKKSRKHKVKIEVTSEESVERKLPKDDTNNRQTEISNFSSSPTLPTKKLILHRFRSNVVQKYEVPLREQNSNCSRQMNFAEKQTKENTPLMLQTRAKKYRRCNRVNKENVSKISLNLEEQLNVKLDKDITVPVVTQMHRDFLGAIDFDDYRIF